jgi:hypothetical protein
MTHFASKSLATLSLAAAFAACLAAAPARAGSPTASIWTPMVYSLGGPSAIPVVISTRLDTADNEEEVVVTGQRAPRSSILAPDLGTPQSAFNVGGNPLIRPAECMQEYTTVGGQPASAADLSIPAGIRDCYY